MTETTIKRSQYATFLRTGTGPDVWSLIGSGVVAGTVNMNPDVTTETYVHEDGATTTIDHYAPVMPIEQTAIEGNPVFDFVNNLYKTRAVGSAAETYILQVELYKSPVSTDQYPAKKQKVSIQIDSFGGDGGKAPKINYTINYIGDPVAGLYDVSAGSFA